MHNQKTIEIPDALRDRYNYIKKHSAKEVIPGVSLEITAEDRIGLLSDITSAAATLEADINYLQCYVEYDGKSKIILQSSNFTDGELISARMLQVTSVLKCIVRPSQTTTFGKRIIVLGGGAQVAQVASGAIAEADRHNIRGETISVDTIAVVGEKELSEAVRGVGRLPRAAVLVLAGALMGGDVSLAVQEIRSEYGIPVISLRMAGSVNRYSDLVVTDPVEAGVMAVMLISHIGKFNLEYVEGREF